MIYEDVEKILIPEDEIKEIIKNLAKKISEDYKNSPKKLVLLCVLKGSIHFASELMRAIDIPTEIDFIKASSYGSSTTSSGLLKISFDLTRNDMSEVNILIVEDIIDSGRTLSILSDHIKSLGAYSVKTITLLDKPSRRTVNFNSDYVGKVIPDEFVIGYGLDYDEKYRDLPYIGILKRSVYEK